MTDPFDPGQGAADRALPALQDHARNRVDLHRAIYEYEGAVSLHHEITTMIVDRYTDYLPDLPHEQLKQKLTGDVRLVQDTMQILSGRGQILAGLARKLEGYIPSGDTAG
jgi:hypothetical protein